MQANPSNPQYRISSMKENQPSLGSLHFKRSKIMLIWLISVYAVAIFTLIITPLASVMKIVIVPMIVVGLVFNIRHQFFTGWSAPKTIYLQSDKQWRIYNRQGKSTSATLQHSLIFQYLIIAYLRNEQGNRITILIPYDALDQSQHRQLRAKLRFLSYEDNAGTS